MPTLPPIVPEGCPDTLACMSRGTPQVRLRVPPALWDRFGRAAEAAGSDRSEVMRALIRWYLGDGEAPAREAVAS